jgi:23S rRNA G2069 N7-methylase RlmK/C1962 C5-methylase RlmI
MRERDRREIEQFRATLANNVRHLRRYPSRGITCYRVYEKDSPDVPLVIDRYEDRVHVFEYEREHSRNAAQQGDWLDSCRDVIAEVMQTPKEHVYMKMRLRQRGLRQHERLGDSNETFEVQEDGLRFLVNLNDYTDTGLFLDHRLTRQMVRKQAAGKRFLNLFCYTGSFTVYAAAGGAASTSSVDLSYTYLDWAHANLDLNGLDGPQHRYMRSDIRRWLRDHPVGPHYDLAIVDPPTFSNSKSTEEDWDVLRDHP